MHPDNPSMSPLLPAAPGSAFGERRPAVSHGRTSGEEGFSRTLEQESRSLDGEARRSGVDRPRERREGASAERGSGTEAGGIGESRGAEKAAEARGGEAEPETAASDGRGGGDALPQPPSDEAAPAVLQAGLARDARMAEVGREGTPGVAGIDPESPEKASAADAGCRVVSLRAMFQEPATSRHARADSARLPEGGGEAGSDPEREVVPSGKLFRRIEEAFHEGMRKAQHSLRTAAPRVESGARELSGVTAELSQRSVEPFGSVVGQGNAPAGAQGAEPGFPGVARSGGITLSHAFGQPGWDHALGEKVAWMLGQKIQGAEIRMNPPHLGPLEVRIQMHNEQAQVQFASQHAVVREAIEAALPRLRDLMAQAGVSLGDVSVTTGNPQGQERETGSGGLGQGGQGAAAGGVPEEARQEPERMRPIAARPSSGLDIFV